jgi:hypothetical protein
VDAQDYVVTITGIERAVVADIETVSNPNASDYVVTIGGIERADILDAVGTLNAVDTLTLAENTPNASDCVVASKSISDTCIDYFFYPKHGDNISFVGKRYIAFLRKMRYDVTDLNEVKNIEPENVMQL